MFPSVFVRDMLRNLFACWDGTREPGILWCCVCGLQRDTSCMSLTFVFSDVQQSRKEEENAERLI